MICLYSFFFIYIRVFVRFLISLFIVCHFFIELSVPLLCFSFCFLFGFFSFFSCVSVVLLGRKGGGGGGRLVSLYFLLSFLLSFLLFPFSFFLSLFVSFFLYLFISLVYFLLVSVSGFVVQTFGLILLKSASESQLRFACTYLLTLVITCE